MLAALFLAVCLDIPRAHDSAYAILVSGSSWSCGDQSDLAAARAAALDAGDLIWFRLDESAYVIREAADLADMASILEALREREAGQTGLSEKLSEYDAELARLDAERTRLAADRERYAPGSEKNRAVATEWSAVDERFRVLAARRDLLASDDARSRDALRRDFDAARYRLGLIVERALRHGTAHRPN